MNVLYFLVPLALILAAVGVAAFVWSVRTGQFDDVQTPGMRVIFDDESPSSDGDSHVTVHSSAHQSREKPHATQDGVDTEDKNQPAG